MARILLTAIGSFSADIVIKELKAKGHHVIGADMYPGPWIADACNVDRFYRAPPAVEGDLFIGFISDVCHDEQIDYVIPLTDPEVDLLCCLKESFLASGTVLCVPDENTVRLCRNKYRLPIFLNEAGIENIIPTTLLADDADVEFPMIIKPVSGRSSQGCHRVADEIKLEYLKNTLNGSDYVRQPLLKGNIVTVDVVRDSLTGETVCIPRRELLRNPKGAGTTVEIFEEPELERISALIAEKVGINGTANFEFIETAGGEFYFLEINPRFSAGVAFTQMAGYDMVSNHLNCFMGRPIDRKLSIEKMIIARKYQEYVTMRL